MLELNYRDIVHKNASLIKHVKWRCGHRLGSCKLKLKKSIFRVSVGFEPVASEFVQMLYQLSYEDPYIGSRPIYWVHFDPWKEWNIEWKWCELWKYKWNEDVTITVVIAKQLWIKPPPPKKKKSTESILFRSVTDFYWLIDTIYINQIKFNNFYQFFDR